MLAKRFVDFLERRQRDSARFGKRGAHAHRLTALPGKNERAHDRLLH